MRRSLSSAVVTAFAVAAISSALVVAQTTTPTAAKPAAAKPLLAPATPAATAKAAAPAKTATKAWSAPKTPWGDPDLQGIWSNPYVTPLERPKEFGNRAYLTKEEIAATGLDYLALGHWHSSQQGKAGHVIYAYSGAPEPVAVDQDRAGKVLIVSLDDTPDGRLPPTMPISPERQKIRAERQAAANRFNQGMPLVATELSLPIRCIIRTDSPPYLPTIYNNDFQIYQSPGYVVIAPEMIHSARMIPLDGRPHLGKNLKQWLGDTRGHFEGNTLVIETTNFRTDDGTVWVLAHGKDKKVLAQNDMITAVRATPVVANGTLYVMTENKLYAINNK